MNELQEKILARKRETNTLILAHYYQSLEVQDVADAVGDSFALAQKAQSADCENIVMCGVRFMAESAKILSPEKTVYQPNAEASCPMAEMVTPEDVLALREKYPEAAVVCYVNSTAAVKAVSDVCCTSSSAERIVRALPNKQIIFVPDKNLGAWCAKAVPEKEIILFSGFCPIHDGVTEEMAAAARNAYPGAKFAVHPECRAEVVGYADCVGSTAEILRYVRESAEPEFVIGTECGVTEILRREFPEKQIHLLREDFVCADMKKTTLMDLWRAVNGELPPVTLPEEELTGAKRALERMVSM